MREVEWERDRHEPVDRVVQAGPRRRVEVILAIAEPRPSECLAQWRDPDNPAGRVCRAPVVLALLPDRVPAADSLRRKSRR